ncbi:MAG: acylphosphatase [Myxococcales bacterium]|nr:acylphosphatase [Myxococcales bacterium]
MKRRVRFRASGRVQGVAYRASAVDQARADSLVGWVRNLVSGEVDGVVEGEATAVDSFLAWAARGPSGARVERLSVIDEVVDESEFTRFEIRR